MRNEKQSFTYWLKSERNRVVERSQQCHRLCRNNGGKLKHPGTPKIDCKEGCSYCCYQTVPVTAPEVFAIAEFIRSSESGSQAETRMAKLVDVNQKTQKLAPRERTKRHLACAFLENGTCSIYPVRPLACAEFTSMELNDCKRAYRVGFKPRGIVHEKARMMCSTPSGKVCWKGCANRFRHHVRNTMNSPQA